MFSLHERTQRKVCRTAFVLFCTVPTFVTLCWVAYFHRPWHERDWQQALESELHLRVEIGAATAPRPQTRTIEYVKLSDLQATGPMIELHSLQIEAENSVKVQSATVGCHQFRAIAEAVRIWLGGDSARDLKYQIQELSLVSADGTQWSLRDVSCEAKVTPTGVRQCLICAQHISKPIRLSIEYKADGKIHAVMDAQQCLLPAWLLADILPGASGWHNSTVTGVMHLEARNDEVTGRFRGQVDAINTQRWIGNDSIQVVATMQLDDLTWRDGGIETVRGSLQAARGKISNAFLQLLKEKLLCSLSVGESQLRNKKELQEIDGLGCQFQLSKAGLAISGMFPWGETSKGCIITSAGKPLVSSPAMPTLPLSQLVQLVSPHNPYWVPATREAINLGEKLPLPKSATQKK